MFNLLPKEEKEGVFKEYKRRLLVISLFFLSISLVVLLVVLSFALNVVWGKVVDAEDAFRVASQSLKAKEYEISSKLLAETEVKLKVLRDTKKETYVHDYFDAVLKKKWGGVGLTGFAYQSATGDLLGELSVEGVADSRDDLFSFVKSLETERLFTAVDSPLSNLTKGKDADFSIKMRLSSKYD